MGNNYTSAHLSDMARSDFLAVYNGAVETQFAKESFMRQFANIQTVTNTDTFLNRRVGRTTLQKLVPGVSMTATPTKFGKRSVTVDTTILARDNQSMLNVVQADFDVKSELGRDHGKEMGRFFDEAFFIQAIKGAMDDNATEKANLNGAIGAGKKKELNAASDALDPDHLAEAIEDIVTEMREEEIDTEGMVVAVRPTQFSLLLKAQKLVNRDWSTGNGDYARRELFYLGGVRIMETARIPKKETATGTHHFLSNAENGYAYDLKAEEAKALAVIIHEKSFLAGESIPLTSDMWWNREEKQWYIDSYTAFGVTWNRPDVCGVVLAKG